MNAYVISQLPLILGFVALLLLASLRPFRKESLSTPLSLLALFLSAYFHARYLLPGDVYFGGAIQVGALGRVISITSLLLLAAGILLSDNYLEKVRVQPVDFKLLLLAMGLGLSTVGMAGDLSTLFISYELISIPSYVLAGLSVRDPRSNEAGLKYLLLGIFTSVLFLLGISFLYGMSGEIDLTRIQDAVTRAVETGSPDAVFARFSLACFLGAIFFKVGVAPFHGWLPDVYQGSSLSALAIIGAPVKVAVFGMLASLLWGPFGALHGFWMPLLLLFALVSVVLPAVQALTQSNVKRLLGYSAVVNAGFILLGVLSASPRSLAFYLLTYGVMTLGLIAAFMALGTKKADIDDLSDLAGLGKTHPVLAIAITVLLFSYAGIPLTAGFAAKFAVVHDAYRLTPALPDYALPALIALLALSLISFYFYFQFVKAIWLTEPVPAGGVGAAGAGTGPVGRVEVTGPSGSVEVTRPAGRTGGAVPEAAPQAAAAAGGSARLLRDFRWNYLVILGLSVLLILALSFLARIPGL